MRKILSLLLFIISALFAQAQYNALLWKITGNGLKKPSYLYGTMHTSDARILRQGDKALPYLEQTKQYAMELDPKESFNIAMLEKVMMGKGYSLKKMIPEREYKLIDSLVENSTGVSLALFDNISPVFISAIVEADGSGLQKSTTGESFLDTYLSEKAAKKKKTVVGIETVDEQIGALNVLSYQEQADLLVDAVHDLEKGADTGGDMVKYYLEQNLDSIAEMDATADMPPKLYRALVIDRNKRMAERIGDMAQKQSTFAAVGALHLPGNEGVISLLREKGYTVEAVKMD
ncbi:MAG: TraB/GumN family protein [Bacteroidetes bacterium]|nr:TraB/GumN family protein [Bacteroidota bacterium]